MKARDLLLPVARDVIGRHTVATGGTGALIASDDAVTQTIGGALILANLIADFVLELRKRRELKRAAPARGCEQAPHAE